jgi:Tol biopolymer transport system component
MSPQRPIRPPAASRSDVSGVVARSASPETAHVAGQYPPAEQEGRDTTNPGGQDSPLAFSPDGSRLLISRVDPDPDRDEPANQALFVTSVSGGQPDQITPWGLSDDYASWSPDGRTIVFGTNGALYRVSPEGQGLAEITLKMADGSSPENAFDVAFSPDGTRIVFSLGSPEPGIDAAATSGPKP